MRKTIEHEFHSERKIYGIDINLRENKASSIKEIKIGEYKTLIITNNATYFFGEKDHGFFIAKVATTDNIIFKNYKLKRDVPSELLKKIKGEKNIYIKTSEYVDIGSTSASQIFKYGNVFYVTYDNNRKPETYMYKLPFSSEDNYEVSFKKFSSSLPKNRIHKSFLTAEYLFEFSVGRKEAVIDVFNHDTGALIKSFTYSHEKFGPYHEYYFKGKSVAPKEERFFKSFNKFRLYSTYLPAPFITINMASNKGYIIEIGHVNGNTYQYNFHHNWMWQQQMMNNTIPVRPKFGPNSDNYNDLSFYIEPIYKTSLKLAIDNSFNVTEKLTETIYNNIDYNKTINTTTQKKLSYANFNEFVRYMAFDKSRKSFIVKDKKIIK